MKQIIKLTAIGFAAGIVLIVFLKIVQSVNGSTAYILLFNFDYIPIIQDLKPEWFFGYVFHFVTCIVSVIVLFDLLKMVGWQKRIIPYLIVYTIGGGGLFFLTALSEKPPAPNDGMAWLYWTLAHAVFAYSVGAMIKKWT